MIQIIPKDALGHFQNEWLDSRHHFSFGTYYDEQRMKFGPLRVINDDVIKAGSGFGLHPHNDMEIITYVRTGAVHHRDSLGNKGKTMAGDVQVMSAGTGIAHAEYADPDQDTTLFQIWIEPRQKALPPRWEQAAFPANPASEGLSLLVSGRAQDAASGALLIHQEAAIYGGIIESQKSAHHKLSGPTGAYVLVSAGEITLNGHVMKAGDGAEITQEADLDIRGLTDAELLVIEV